ncbi:MAG: YcxB family protein [Bacteroidota bacterium]
MNISFTQTAEDLYAFQRFFFVYSLRRFFKPLYKKLLVGAVSLVLIIAFLRELLAFGRDLMAVDWGSSYAVVQVFMSHVIIFIVLFVVFLLYRNFATKRLIDRSIRYNSELLGEREIEFREGGLVVTTPSSSTEYESNTFRDWASTDHSEFLMMGKKSTIFMPRRAFDELQYGEYLSWREANISNN